MPFAPMMPTIAPRGTEKLTPWHSVRSPNFLARLLTSITTSPRRGPGGMYSRSEEHTSELQSLMRISYAVFCLKQKKNRHTKLHIKQLTAMSYTNRDETNT